MDELSARVIFRVRFALFDAIAFSSVSREIVAIVSISCPTLRITQTHSVYK